MPRELNHYHLDAINLRKTQAHMYAAGWNDANRARTDYVPQVDELEFSRYVEALARDYYSEVTYFMPSIPAALESFRLVNQLNKAGK